MVATLFILWSAVVVDAIWGDPVYRLHPVRLMGDLATVCEQLFRRMHLDGVIGGMLFWLVHISVTTGAFVALHLGFCLMSQWCAILFDVAVVYSMYAHRDLLVHAKRVLEDLQAGRIDAARKSVSQMVGRRTAELDVPAIARATVESVAENFVDGSFAVLFWMMFPVLIGLLLGKVEPVLAVACTVVYRSANTLDAMVGHRNERYSRFGRFSARADDVLNFLPARLSVIPLLLAAALHRGNVLLGIRVWMSDRQRTPSPNSGQPESCMAGILGVRLGGPVAYGDGVADNRWIGEGLSCASVGHLQTCLVVVTSAQWIAMIGVTLATVPFWGGVWDLGTFLDIAGGKIQCRL